jgi:subtilisin family serine protease
MTSKRFAFLIAVLAGLMAFSPAPAPAGLLSGVLGLLTGLVRHEVLVYLKPGTDVTRFLRDYNVAILDQVPGRLCLRCRTGLLANETNVASAMSKDARVVAAQPHYTGSVLEFNSIRTANSQWSSGFNGDPTPAGYANLGVAQQVDYNLAPQRTQGAGVTVAVLDTGISLLQPALVAQSLAGWNFVDNTPATADTPDRIDSNGNGVRDEGVGHGTMVAGLVYRFAPQARLLPVKVLDSDGQGRLWDTLKGLYYAVDHGARVINTSWSTYQESPVLKQALSDCWTSGVIVASSAGNDNLNGQTYPGGYPYALTVAALNADNTKAYFSNYGVGTELAAPGVGLVSLGYIGGTATGSGTSFSAPIVAAEAALVWSVRPTWTVSQVRDRMLTTSHSVDPWNPNYPGMLGYPGQGLIDFDQAVAGL